nr:PREDICTED: nascent polypeptide-associated complex subunit alpha, muscle-specific form-like [Musa acuminata subsp. malaccensis]
MAFVPPRMPPRPFAPPPPKVSPSIPPPPNRRSPPPPSPSKQTPPPPPRRRPPPPPPPKKAPPPPPRRMAPPPAPVRPPPLVPPPPSPNHTVIIVVFVSLGGLLLLACLAAALFCCIKKRKKKMAFAVDVADRVHVHETVVPGPHGQQLATRSIDEDVKVHEVFKKGAVTGEASLSEPASGKQRSSSTIGGAGAPVTGRHHLLWHKGGDIVVEVTTDSSTEPLLPSRASYAHNLSCANNELKNLVLPQSARSSRGAPAARSRGSPASPPTSGARTANPTTRASATIAANPTARSATYAYQSCTTGTAASRKAKKKMAAKRQAVDVHQAAVRGPHRQQPAAPTAIDDDNEIHELMEEGRVIESPTRCGPSSSANSRSILQIPTHSILSLHPLHSCPRVSSNIMAFVPPRMPPRPFAPPPPKVSPSMPPPPNRQSPPPPSPSKQTPPPPPRRRPPPPPPPKKAPPPPPRRSPPPPPPPKQAPPPPPRRIAPPPPKLPPPPPRRSPPPPPPPKQAPPPPPRRIAPPPPKLPPLQPPPAPVRPPPLVPPPPSPNHTVIIVVFVSLGGLLLLACLAAALFCCIKKRKKKMAAKSEDVDVADRVHVHETVVPGPHGQQLATRSIDEGIKVHEVIKKGAVTGEASLSEPASGKQRSSSRTGGAGPSVTSDRHFLEHKG